jgi:hypothetical protein
MGKFVRFDSRIASPKRPRRAVCGMSRTADAKGNFGGSASEFFWLY